MQRLRAPTVILVGVIWTIAFLMGAATHDYTALTYTTPLAMAAAAAVLARNGNNKNGGPK